jgi:predicted nucleic acid-binding protein
VIAVDTSVIVRYLVGSPPLQAAAAAALIDASLEDLGVSPVVLLECAHVLRTQYGVGERDIVDALVAFLQRENVVALGVRTESLVEALVRARTLPGRPIADALIVATASASGATALATFDRGQARHGFPVVAPQS